MNKTLYLKPEDEKLWLTAKRIAELRQTNISSVVIDALHHYVSRNMHIANQIEGLLKDMEKRKTA